MPRRVRPALVSLLIALACACDDSGGKAKGSAPADAAAGGLPVPALDAVGPSGGTSSGTDALPERPAPGGAGGSGDPGPGNGGAGPSGGSAGAGGGGGEPDPPGQLACEDIPIAETIEQACTRAVQCGPGGICAGLSADLMRCHQLCVPERCQGMCPPDVRCRVVLGQDGQPRLLDEGSPVGVCDLPPPPAGPPVDAYRPCAADAPCAEGLECVSFAEPAGALCLPTCEPGGEACPMDGACVPGVDAARPDSAHCLLLCEDPAACPAELACSDTVIGPVCLSVPVAPP